MSFIKPFVASPSKKSTSLDVLVATAGDLQRGLSSGESTSVELVEAYLDPKSKSMMATYTRSSVSPPRARLVEQARKLDEERENKAVRGKLHGIPILIKDNIATLPKLHMGTTAGTFAAAHQEASLIQLQSAWEATFPARKTPSLE